MMIPIIPATLGSEAGRWKVWRWFVPQNKTASLKEKKNRGKPVIPALGSRGGRAEDQGYPPLRRASRPAWTT